MSKLTRRSFMGALGATVAMGTVAGTALADAASAETGTAAEAAGTFVPGGGSFAEGAIEAVGGSTMPLAELNRRRKAYIDSKTEDHVCEDGTVVPVVFVKAAAKLNSIGTGTLDVSDNGVFPDGALLTIMADLNEEQAQFYLDIPTDVNFNVIDASVASGKSVDECYELLDHLWSRGYLAKHERNDGTAYHCFPFFQGLAEMFTLNHFTLQDPVEINPNGSLEGMPGMSYNKVMLDQGTPVFHAVPVNVSVMAEGSTVLPYEDVREIIKTKKTLSLGPCTCRWMKARAAGSESLPSWEDFIDRVDGCYDYFDETIGQYIETCIYMDDEAENGIAMGWAHEATADEVLAALERAAEEGYIIHVAGGTRCETICCCSVDAGCGMCTQYDGLGDAVLDYPAFDQKRRYVLEVDLDACVGCGACVTRCPMHAVELGDDGKPVVGATCVTCGQCGVTCPVGARKLANRPAEEIAELPESFVEDNMVKAAYRFEHGLIQ